MNPFARAFESTQPAVFAPPAPPPVDIELDTLLVVETHNDDDSDTIEISSDWGRL